MRYKFRMLGLPQTSRIGVLGVGSDSKLVSDFWFLLWTGLLSVMCSEEWLQPPFNRLSIQLPLAPAAHQSLAQAGIYIFKGWLRAFWVVWQRRASSLWNIRLVNRCFWKPLLPNLLRFRKEIQVRHAATLMWQMATFSLLGLRENLCPFLLNTPKSCHQALMSRALSVFSGWNKGIDTKQLHHLFYSCWEVVREFKRQN